VNGGRGIPMLNARMAFPNALIVAFLLVITTGDVSAETRSVPSFRVIVNAANTLRSMTRSEIVRLFLKKMDWPSHQQVLPVDLPEDSETRRSFSTDLLGRTVASINSYWQFMIFSGRATPPVSVQSEEEAMKYVRLHREAIGYVSASTPLDAGILEVAIKEESR
jgi:hypothetical protein